MRALLTGFLLLTLSACAATPATDNAADARNDRIFPESWRKTYEEWGYSLAVRSGDTLILSGVPVVGPGTLEEQVTHAYAFIDELLRQAGFDRSHIVELTTYHVIDSTPAFHAQFAEYAKAHKRFFDGHEYPAWSAVGVTALLAPGATVEIRVMARKPSPARR